MQAANGVETQVVDGKVEIENGNVPEDKPSEAEENDTISPFHLPSTLALIPLFDGVLFDGWGGRQVSVSSQHVDHTSHVEEGVGNRRWDGCAPSAGVSSSA